MSTHAMGVLGTIIFCNKMLIHMSANMSSELLTGDYIWVSDLSLMLVRLGGQNCQYLAGMVVLLAHFGWYWSLAKER